MSGGWDFWRDGLDSAFFQGTYAKSAVLTAVAALLFLGFDDVRVVAAEATTSAEAQAGIQAALAEAGTLWVAALAQQDA